MTTKTVKLSNMTWSLILFLASLIVFMGAVIKFDINQTAKEIKTKPATKQEATYRNK
jgi:Na+-transporting methylmalonyl-CoA/oxaloacetate decarboxylase gamma subunit